VELPGAEGYVCCGYQPQGQAGRQAGNQARKKEASEANEGLYSPKPLHLGRSLLCTSYTQPARCPDVCASLGSSLPCV